MDYAGGDKVIFNEGVAVVYRLDEIQKQITICSLNPAAMNVSLNTFNYKLWINFLTALQREILADLVPNDLKKAEQLRKAIVEFEKKFPVYESIQLKVHPYTLKSKLNERALNILVEKLNDYGAFLMVLKKKHGYSNPQADDPGSFMKR